MTVALPSFLIKPPKFLYLVREDIEDISESELGVFHSLFPFSLDTRTQEHEKAFSKLVSAIFDVACSQFKAEDWIKAMKERRKLYNPHENSDCQE